MDINQVKGELEKHGTFKPEEMQQHYDEVAAKYDELYLTVGYYDHLKCLEMAEQLIPDQHNQVRPSLSVLDMGCGTGLVGEVMYKAGFTNIEGVDISQGMLDQAALKADGKAYSKLSRLALGDPENFPEEFIGKYDIIVASGILAQGHLDSRVFQEMLLSAKGTGSIVIFTTREAYLTDLGYQTAMDQLETEGKWKFIRALDFKRYDQLGEEQVGRYKQVEIKCFAYLIQ